MQANEGCCTVSKCFCGGCAGGGGGFAIVGANAESSLVDECQRHGESNADGVDDESHVDDESDGGDGDGDGHDESHVHDESDDGDNESNVVDDGKSHSVAMGCLKKRFRARCP